MWVSLLPQYVKVLISALMGLSCGRGGTCKFARIPFAPRWDSNCYLLMIAFVVGRPWSSGTSLLARGLCVAATHTRPSVLIFDFRCCQSMGPQRQNGWLPSTKIVGLACPDCHTSNTRSSKYEKLPLPSNSMESFSDVFVPAKPWKKPRPYLQHTPSALRSNMINLYDCPFGT